MDLAALEAPLLRHPEVPLGDAPLGAPDVALRVRVCVCACVRACVRAGARARARGCVHARVCGCVLACAFGGARTCVQPCAVCVRAWMRLCVERDRGGRQERADEGARE